MEQFLEMLEFMRPAWNPYEDAFIKRYISPLNPMVDKFGNQIIDVGSKPNIIWSSHTDTVHFRGGLQRVEVNKQRVVGIEKSKSKAKSRSNCLGADCTTGVFIMIKMIEASVEGRYIFHRAEEIGAQGSRYILKNTPDLLKGISAAVAFDRKGKNEVITHQGSRTCSDAFAKSVAKVLTGYAPSDMGAFTDTKIYAPVIPECTNIGVGYERMHSPQETQDLVHLEWLVDKMTKFDTSGLEIARDPSTPDPEDDWGWGHGGSWRPQAPKTVYDLVFRYPKELAAFLEENGVTFEQLDEIVTEQMIKRNSAKIANH